MNANAFRALLRPFSEPYLLVRPDGAILARNAAADAMDVLTEDTFRASTTFISFLQMAVLSGAFVPGVLPIDRPGTPVRYRCDGARLDTEQGPLVLLRVRRTQEAAARFLTLNERIDALNREIRDRQRAESALQEQTAQLEELAAELEHTLDEVQLQRDAAEAAHGRAASAARAKGDFLAMMSHELRTPLNAILGFTDLLQEDIDGPLNEKQRSHVQRIRRSARHLISIIEQILAFSRVDSGAETLTLASDVDPVALAEEVLALLQPVASARGLTLNGDWDGARPLHTDARKVSQILINLVSNGLKYTEEGGVTMRIACPAGHCVFEVEDTGVGIAAADLERVFEPFVQIEPSPLTRRVGGTGLGLAVSRSLATLLGGAIEVESTPGAGSRFRLRLPIGGPSGPTGEAA